MPTPNIAVLISETIEVFGDYLAKNPTVQSYPEVLVAIYRDKFHCFWQKNFNCCAENWARSDQIKGVSLGTIVATDIALYAKKYQPFCETLFIRDPFTKLLQLGSLKTSYGLFLEMSVYLNTFVEIESLIHEGFIQIYPPFYLFDEGSKSTIINYAELMYQNSQLQEIALTCQDRHLKPGALLEYYRLLFHKLFNDAHMCLAGGDAVFTRDYIVRTMCQDVLTAYYLARKINAIPVTCIARHEALLKAFFNEFSVEPIQIVKLPFESTLNKRGKK